MKKRIALLLFFILFALKWSTAQLPVEAELLFHWQDDDLPVNSWLNSRYNEVWGFLQNGREYAVIGSTNGTHIFDITEPESAYEAAYVPGWYQGSGIIHRDYHDYKGYLYAVADEGNSTLQIIDLSGLPDQVELIYDSDILLTRAHNIFIDSARAKLYALGTANSFSLFSVCVYSLDDPTNPFFLGCFPNANANIPYVHDAFVRNDTAWLNCGSSGLYIVDFSDPQNPEILGTMDGYPQEGYNHSGWMHETLPYYYMADETLGSDLKVVDVSDLNDLHVLNTFNSEPSDGGPVIPHNLIVRGDYLYVSYYFEGLQVYDISDPVNPQRIMYYDTYPEEVDVNQLFFQGAWGVYPFLPSGRILVSDLNNGLFVFKSVEETTTATQSIERSLQTLIQLSPNPVQDQFHIHLKLPKPDNIEATYTLYDLQGRVIQSFGKRKVDRGMYEGAFLLSPNTATGLYLLQIHLGHAGVIHLKVLKQ